MSIISLTDLGKHEIVTEQEVFDALEILSDRDDEESTLTAIMYKMQQWAKEGIHAVSEEKLGDAVKEMILTHILNRLTCNNLLECEVEDGVEKYKLTEEGHKLTKELRGDFS